MLGVLSLAPRLVRVQFLGAPISADRAEVLSAHFEPAGPGSGMLRVLAAMHVASEWTAPVGGELAPIYEAALTRAGVDVRLCSVATALAMEVRQHAWDPHGRLETRAFPEPAPRLCDGDLRGLERLVTERLPTLRGLLLAAAETPPGADFLLQRLAAGARDRAVALCLCTGEDVLPDAIAGGPRYLVTGSRAAGRCGEFRETFFAAGGEALVVTDGAGPVELTTAERRTRIEPPTASDRGGRGAREVLAAAMLAKVLDDWELVSAVSYGIAAATAQIQKELGGTLRQSEIEGFFAQVRVQEE